MTMSDHENDNYDHEPEAGGFELDEYSTSKLVVKHETKN